MYVVCLDDDASVVEYDGKLETLQDLVHGFVEIGEFFGEYAAIVDEEGLYKGLKRNRYFPRYVGPVVIVRIENDDFAGMSKTEAANLAKCLDVLGGMSRD